MDKKIIFSLAILCILLVAKPVFAASESAYLIDITSTTFLPSSIYSGDVVSLAVDIQNKGLSIPIVDLNASLALGNQFEAIDSNDYTTYIPPGATQTLVFQFKTNEGTVAGYYPIFLNMTYLRSDKPVTESQTIFVPISKTEKNIEVTVEPKVINPGNQSQITFTFKNVSETPVSNISFSWSEADSLILPLGSDNKGHIPIIRANSSQSLSYTVAADPNITTGIYPLNITTTFNDSNGTKTQTSQVGIIIGGTTDFEVSAETLASGQLSLSIANVGSNNASALVVKIPQQSGIRISGTNVAILGNLNRGDYTIASFQTPTIDQNANTQGGQQNSMPFGQNSTGQPGNFDRNSFTQRAGNKLTIELDYTDTTGERQIVQKDVQLNLSASSTSGFAGATGRAKAGSFSILWILLAVIAIALTAYNKFKAKKPWKSVLISLAIIAALCIVGIFFTDSSMIVAIVAAAFSAAVLYWFYVKQREIHIHFGKKVN